MKNQFLKQFLIDSNNTGGEEKGWGLVLAN